MNHSYFLNAPQTKENQERGKLIGKSFQAEQISPEIERNPEERFFNETMQKIRKVLVDFLESLTIDQNLIPQILQILNKRIQETTATNQNRAGKTEINLKTITVRALNDCIYITNKEIFKNYQAFLEWIEANKYQLFERSIYKLAQQEKIAITKTPNKSHFKTEESIANFLTFNPSEERQLAEKIKNIQQNNLKPGLILRINKKQWPHFVQIIGYTEDANLVAKILFPEELNTHYRILNPNKAKSFQNVDNLELSQLMRK